jgi:RNA polymerase sigma factor (sigma-70 family)
MTRAAWRRRTGEDVAALVRKAAAGDEDSWRELVGEFGGVVGSVTRGYRLRPADAADVAQATWLKLVEHLDDLHDLGRVGPWLATTARRECLRVLRDGRRHVLVGDEEPHHEETDVPVDDALLRAERDLALRRSFSQLRGSDQALLRLLMAEPRLAYEEISTALAMPIGSIGPTRARALERLRRELDRQGVLALVAA